MLLLENCENKGLPGRLAKPALSQLSYGPSVPAVESTKNPRRKAKVLPGRPTTPFVSISSGVESGWAPPDPTRSVLINVSVSDQLLEKFSPEDTLFIYAQALEGMPMPLAVIRTRAEELPMEVTLDDSMAMVPTHKISDFDMVKIQARISQSGDAEVNSGDIVGLINEVSVADTDVLNLVISEIIP